MKSYRKVFSKKGGAFCDYIKIKFYCNICCTCCSTLFVSIFKYFRTVHISGNKNKNAEPSIQIQADSTLLENKLENKTDYSTAIHSK